MIGIIAAMEEELAEIIKVMKDQKDVPIENSDYVFIKGTIANKEVVCVLSRVGKLNAALTTSLLINHFNISLVINIGSAGGIGRGLKLLDVVLATATSQHDLWVGRAKGEVSGSPRFVETIKEYTELAYKALNDLDLDGSKIYKGLIVSGDQFILTKQAGEIIKDFPDAMCVEMESAAVNFICYKLNVPCIIIRSVSDIPHNEGNEMTFEEYLPYAGRNAAKVCQKIIESI